MVTRRITALTAFGFCLVLAVPGLAFGQDKNSPPVWTSDQTRSNALGAESKSDAWSIRPPRDWQTKVTKAETEIRTVWGKEKVGAIIVTQALTKPLEGRTLEDGLESVVAVAKSRSKNLTNTPFERGVINGKTWLRTRYTAEDVPGFNGKVYGFIYATFDSKTPFVISGIGFADSIENLEASAQTFKVLK